jgi:hypothetical protein
MPVAFKLSRQVYEKLGDETVNELVDWFNKVDLTYRSDLRELNEVNFARFDAKVEQRFAEFELWVDRRFADLELRFDRRLAEVENRIEARLDAKLTALQERIDAKLAALEARIDAKLAALEARIDAEARFAAVHRRITELEAKTDTGFERLRSEMVSFKAELIKWMFLFWLGTVATTLAITQALR